VAEVQIVTRFEAVAACVGCQHKLAAKHTSTSKIRGILCCIYFPLTLISKFSFTADGEQVCDARSNAAGAVRHRTKACCRQRGGDLRDILLIPQSLRMNV